MHSSALIVNVTKFMIKPIKQFNSRHGKDIIHQQFLLGRIAQAAIDIYSQTSVLSRCTVSLNERTPSALHEELMAKVRHSS